MTKTTKTSKAKKADATLKPFLVTARNREQQQTGRAYVYGSSMADACVRYAAAMHHTVDCYELTAQWVR